MIELKSVLHYYIGRTIQLKRGDTTNIERKLTGHTIETIRSGVKDDIEYKLYLRPLTSLTDDEKVKWYDMINGKPTDIEYPGDIHWAVNIVNQWIDGVKENMKTAFTPAEFHYLLSIGIDLFNLIETKQAIAI